VVHHVAFARVNKYQFHLMTCHVVEVLSGDVCVCVAVLGRKEGEKGGGSYCSAVW
jgi:hypothetical protein